MRDSRTRILTFTFIVLSLSLLSSCAIAQANAIWPSYHFDNMRTGQNPNSTDITDPGLLNLIWVSPRTGGAATEDDKIVDDTEAAKRPGWIIGSDPEAWEEGFAFASIKNKVYATLASDEGTYVRWDFPSAVLPKGYYNIYVWVPSTPIDPDEPQNTSQAEYTVSDDYGVITIKFDQRDGGYWKLLTTRQFYFTGANPNGNYVKLTNITEDHSPEPEKGPDGTYLAPIPVNPNIRIVADAVKFVPATGMEIYSSPASATIPWSHTWNDPPETWTGNVAAVFVGTVENPLTNSNDSPDTGAIYCINSVTESVNPPVTALMLELADQCGTNIWRYPNSNPADRNEIEGPIEGGVYSSPTLAYVNLDRLGTDIQLGCYVAANDRQLYALNAETGELLWKGPGMTVGETGGLSAGWTDESNRADAFGGKFRKALCTTSNTGYDTATWNFSDADRQAAGEPNPGGYSYTVYAWMPAMLAGDLPRAETAKYKITFAKLVGPGDLPTEEVTVDQSDIDNQGKWVRLGDYFNVSKVELISYSADAVADTYVVADAMMIVPATVGSFEKCSPVVPTNTTSGAASNVYVVSSDGRLLNFDTRPLDVPTVTDPRRFGQSYWIYPQVRTKLNVTSPADGDMPSMGEIGASPAYHNDKLYIACADGKVRCVDTTTTPPDESKGWIFPNYPVDEKEHTGGFTSSPAIDSVGGYLYIGSIEGVFYCLHLGRKDPASQLRAKNPVDWGVGGSSESMPFGGFHFSTPAIAMDGVPGNDRRVWIGSTDNHIYSFGANDGDPDKFMTRLHIEYDPTTAVETRVVGKRYVEPSGQAAIQGSVALDSSSKGIAPMVMYFGDMQGKLHWFNANSGSPVPDSTPPIEDPITTINTFASELFASPNITNLMVGAPPGVAVSYIYVAGSNGRIYAFSRTGGAWGGEWALGSWWPFEGTPTDNAMKETATNFNSTIQFDIFPSDLCTNTESYDVERTFVDGGTTYHTPPSAYTPAWPAETPSTAIIVSQDMKMPTLTGGTTTIDDDLLTQAKQRRTYTAFKPQRRGTETPIYFEWGETINVVLWNLPPKILLGATDSARRSNVTFNLTNASPGASAGNLFKDIRFKVLKEYTVLESTLQTVPVDHHKPLTIGGTEVKRCFAIAELKIKSNQQQVLSPGPGWVLSVNVKSRPSSGSSSYTTQTLPLARLTAADPPAPLVATDTSGNQIKYVEQKIGINNPLAIKDDASLSIAWPANLEARRDDNEAHFNGNTVINEVPTVDDPAYSIGKMPKLNMNSVAHGTSSRQARLGIMDRSATGCTVISNPPLKTDVLHRFRINAGDLRWSTTTDNAITDAGGIKLPWELGLGSVDYPNLYKRYQDYRKASDDADPAKQHTDLPAIALRTYSGALVKDYNGLPGIANTKPLLRPDTVAVSVDVPRYQPASKGYTRTMEAYIDSNGNNTYESGNKIFGRPATRQEVYRKFKIDLAVRPDPKIEVEEQTIDIGRAPHGLGEFLNWPYTFSPFNPNPEVQKWFKKLTIKNAGNVNLTNVQLDNKPRANYDLKLAGDKNSSFAGIWGTQIVSSLDGNMPEAAPFMGFVDEPFTTGDFGYTITKPRVGDPDPSVMTIPDRRKWNSNYDFTKNNAKWHLERAGGGAPGTGWSADNPLDVKVSVRVPISQPVGSYQSWDKTFNSVFVPVYAGMNGPFYATVKPQAAPSFQLRLNVVENQVTGGVSSLSVLPQVDGAMAPKVGDDTPAAFRDSRSGNVYLFWSSNRILGLDPPTRSTQDQVNAEFANAPWFLNRAMLAWNPGGYFNVAANNLTWWNLPSTDYFIPDFPGVPPNSTQWPPLLAAGTSMSVPKWKYDQENSDYDSVKHHSPVFVENETAPSTADEGRTWLAWAGSADVNDSVTNKMTQEHRIFYTDATDGDVTDDAINVYSIEHDPATAKLHPSASVFRDLREAAPKDRMWMFWQGGESGRWSIFYSTNNGETDGDGNVNFPPANWAKDDLRLRTPDCLASVSSPNVIHRKLWANIRSVTPSFADATHFFDMVYAGTTKFSQTSDIMLSRYAAVTSSSNNASPSRRAQPLPRVFDEKLEKDAKYGFYGSQHLAWIRLGRRGFEGIPSTVQNLALGDYLGRQEHMKFEIERVDPLFTGATPTLDSSTNPDLLNLYNMPYIWVELPANYDGGTWPEGTRISATTGAVTEADGDPLLDANNNPIATGLPIIPEIDDATGIYTYKYTGVVKEILGDMLVDYSTGVVRFTEPLKAVTQTGGTVKVPEVHADYTPQTWRLTTSSSVDNSPRAFIDRTPMDPDVYLGMSGWGGGTPSVPYYAPIDRLWTFWRKAGTGVDSSTIFYKTYRVGVDITKLVANSGSPARPIQWNDATATTPAKVASITVTGNKGPWEVDRSGRRIYFTEVDERYRSLIKSGSSSAFGPLPNMPITVEYTAVPAPGSSVVETQTVNIHDAYWLEELSEQPLFTSGSSVNEGSIYAFADPGVVVGGTVTPPESSKIWVFWTSTRAGTSDLFWETVSPTFTAW